MINTSAALRNAMLVTGSFKSLMDGCFLYIYETDSIDDFGRITVAPETALPGTMLVKIAAAAGASLNWAATADDGVIAKDASQVWESVITASGQATAFRICKGADDGSTTDATKYRIQGTIGAPGSNADVILTNPTLVDNNANTQGMTIFQLQLPGWQPG